MQEYFKRLFGISADTYATIMITLLTFVIGYVITALALLSKVFFERRAIRRLFINMLDSIEKRLSSQEKSIKGTIVSLNIESSEPFVFSDTYLYQFSALKELSFNATFRAYFLGCENYFFTRKGQTLRRKSFNKVWQNLAFLEGWFNKYPDYNKEWMDRFNLAQIQRNQNFNLLRQTYEGLFQEASKGVYKGESEIFLRHLYNIVAEYAKIPTSKRVNPYIVQRKMILPIRILNKKFRHLDMVRDLNDKVLACSHQYREMEMLLRYVKQQYYSWYFDIRTSKKIISISRKIL